jgi:hypothetical protein
MVLEEKINMLNIKLDDSRENRVKLLNESQRIADRNMAIVEKYNATITAINEELAEEKLKSSKLFEENIVLKSKLMKDNFINNAERLEKENTSLREQVNLLRKNLEQSKAVRTKLLDDIQKISDRNMANFEKYNATITEKKNEVLERRKELLVSFEENIELKNKLIISYNEIEKLKNLYITALQDLHTTTSWAMEIFAKYKGIADQSVNINEKELKDQQQD